MSKQTPFYELHQEYNPRMVDFAGYALPISYPEGIIAEHLWTRKKASFFDVSHMGQIKIEGPGVVRFLEKLTPTSYDSLLPGQMKYSVLTNEDGGIIDDLMVTRLTENAFYLVVNAACLQKDVDHFRQYLPKGLVLTIYEDQALFALQGPKAQEILGAYDSSLKDLLFLQAKEASFMGYPCWVSRSGYTGEDGFELSLNKEIAIPLLQELLSHPDLKCAGLGARDSLRLEAGLPLYGDDLDARITPIEAGLSFAVSMSQREQPRFIGHQVILEQLKKGVAKRRVGFFPEGKTLFRKGAPLLDAQENEIGVVSSGTFSPILNRPIAMGYIDSSYAGPIFAVVRNVKRPCTITNLPFYQPHYKRKQVA